MYMVRSEAAQSKASLLGNPTETDRSNRSIQEKRSRPPTEETGNKMASFATRISIAHILPSSWIVYIIFVSTIYMYKTVTLQKTFLLQNF